MKTYQQTNLMQNGGVSAAAARAREEYQGVSLVSYVYTPSEVFTRYVGPPMQVSKIEGAGCLAVSAPDLKVTPTSVAPHEFVIGQRSALCGSCGCCDGKAAFPLEAVAAMGGLPGDNITACSLRYFHGVPSPPPLSPLYARDWRAPRMPSGILPPHAHDPKSQVSR
jgi:hypothetical protein